MGYDLQSLKAPKEENYFRFNIWGWGKVLNLALDHGWKPEGTVLTKEWFMGIANMTEEQAQKEADEWEGHYQSNDFQEVTDSDAKKLQTALKKAVKEDSTLDPEWKEYIKKFIKFLDHGSFAIG